MAVSRWARLAGGRVSLADRLTRHECVFTALRGPDSENHSSQVLLPQDVVIASRFHDWLCCQSQIGTSRQGFSRMVSLIGTLCQSFDCLGASRWEVRRWLLLCIPRLFRVMA